MVRLILFRHAKAADAEPGQADIDRPLTSDGLRDAAATGEALAAAGHFPDLILCSPARRTRQTLSAALPGFFEGVDENASIRLVPPLYNGGDYARIAREDGGSASTLMLVGHNPSTHQTARALAGSGESHWLAEIARKFPTAAAAVIEFEGPDWSAVRAGDGVLIDFLTSK